MLLYCDAVQQPTGPVAPPVPPRGPSHQPEDTSIVSRFTSVSPVPVLDVYL